MDTQYERMDPTRGLLGATAVLLVVNWGSYALDPGAWPGITGALVVTALAGVNVVVTALAPRAKVRAVRLVQRFAVNPLVRALYSVGANPLGLVLLETTGRVSGAPRRVPVGNGREGDTLWIVAEHGVRANWVRNVLADPRVRVHIRDGLRLRWVTGVAEVLPADDPYARQRAISRRHPLRMLNSATVRVLGAELVTVRIDLNSEPDVPRRDVELAA